MKINRVYWTCIAVVGSVCLSLTGCGNGAQNVALIGGAALATYGITNEAVTGSTVTITVERYDDCKGGEGACFRLDHPLAIHQVKLSPATVETDSCAGPFTGMTAIELLALYGRLVSPMTKMTNDRDAFVEKKKVFEDFGAITGASDVASDFGNMANQVTPAIVAWRKLRADVESGEIDDAKPDKVAAAACHLNELKTQLDGIKALKLSDSFVTFVKALVVARAPAGVDKTKLQLKLEDAEKTAPGDNAEKINAIFRTADDAVSIIDSVSPTTAPAANTQPSTAEKKREWTAAVDEVRSYFDVAHQVVIDTNDHIGQARGVLYNAMTSSVSTGPIASETTQMLFSNKALGVVLDPKNKEYWEEMNSCKVESGPGNADTIVYFENLLHPVLKSTNFDPSKFLVANGLIYRKAFATVAQVFGVSGAAGGDAAMPNLMAANATIANADESVAAIKKLRVDALKGILKAAEDPKTTAAQGKSQLTEIAKKLTSASK